MGVVAPTKPIRVAIRGLLVGLCLCAGTSCRRQEQPQGSREPSSVNVLLISIDTLRPDHLGCYGYHRNTSPRIDRLASEGVLFENAISSTSWTLPAHAALFTSLADSVHGCTDPDQRLHDDIVTLAERFAAAGYKTVGFFSGPLLHPAFGLGQGFEHYENCTSYAQVIDTVAPQVWTRDLDVHRKAHQDITNPTVYAAVKRWLAQNGRSKFFLFVHMWDVHFDFIPPAPYDGMFDPDYTGPITGANFFFDQEINATMPKRDLEHLIALYDGEIAWTDHHVGKIVDDLKQAGLLDETVVAITADHGTEFFEHGSKAHRTTLFDEVIRIPLVFRYPRRLPGGRRIRAQTRIIDIGPTLLELAGLAPATDVMGHSLVPLALGQTLDFDNVAISELFSVGHLMRTVRTLEWKFTYDLVTNERYYVNLIEDPGERHPRLDLAQALGRRLLDRYQTVVKDLGDRKARMPSFAHRPTIPKDISEQLKSLGYINR